MGAQPQKEKRRQFVNVEHGKILDERILKPNFLPLVSLEPSPLILSSVRAQRENESQNLGDHDHRGKGSQKDLFQDLADLSVSRRQVLRAAFYLSATGIALCSGVSALAKTARKKSLCSLKNRRKKSAARQTVCPKNLKQETQAKKKPASVSNLSSARLKLHNIHTGKDLCFSMKDYAHCPQNFLSAFNAITADHRSKRSYPMDPKLLALLCELNLMFGGCHTIDLISGYRSKETNALLRQKSRGVAKKSYHMLGKAADIKICGVSVRNLALAARKLRKGGVGCYSAFAHVDIRPRPAFW